MERGVVISFDAERGFGFIRSRAFAADVFVHAEILGGVGLKRGQRVRFEAESTEKGPRALRVVPRGRGLTPFATGLIALGVALIAVSVLLIRAGMPWWCAWLGAINGVTPIVYAIDKHRAALGRRRIPESVLLALALVGGSPGAALAMGILRHKTRKRAFLIPFIAIVVGQIAVIGAWFDLLPKIKTPAPSED